MTLEAETDLSAYVLRLLDDHLEAMLNVRDRLRVSGPVNPGERRTIALDSVFLAESYANRLSQALG